MLSWFIGWAVILWLNIICVLFLCRSSFSSQELIWNDRFLPWLMASSQVRERSSLHASNETWKLTSRWAKAKNQRKKRMAWLVAKSSEVMECFMHCPAIWTKKVGHSVPSTGTYAVKTAVIRKFQIHSYCIHWKDWVPILFVQKSCPFPVWKQLFFLAWIAVCSFSSSLAGCSALWVCCWKISLPSWRAEPSFHNRWSGTGFCGVKQHQPVVPFWSVWYTSPGRVKDLTDLDLELQNCVLSGISELDTLFPFLWIWFCLTVQS